MGKHYYALKREEFSTADSPEKAMVLKDMTQAGDPAMEKAMAQCFLHNRSLFAMTEWLETVSSVNQKVWYRAPEVLLGFASFSHPVDVWALGCVGAEVVSRAPLFQGNAAVILTLQIFKLFGRPSQGLLVDLPLFSKQSPAFEKQPWPPASLRTCQPELQEFLQEALRMDPTERMTVDGAMKHRFLKHNFLQPRKLDVLCPALSAGQGTASLVQGCMNRRLLHWLQTDPAWSRLAESFRGQGSELAASPSASQSRGDRFEQEI